MPQSQWTVPFNLGPNQELNYNLNFPPVSVLVNNPTNFWVYLPSLKSAGWIPPYTLHVIKPWTSREQYVEFQSTKTPPAALSYGLPVGIASIQFTDEVLSYSSGVAYPTNTAPVAHVITDAVGLTQSVSCYGGFGGNSPQSITPSIPVGATGFNWQDALNAIGGAGFTVKGNPTNTIYVNDNTDGSESGSVVLNPADVSLTLTVAAGNNSSAQGQVTFTGTFGSQTDVIDRVARLLGIVTNNANPYVSPLATFVASVGNSTKAIGAGGTEQLLVIYHPNTVAETFKIRKIVLTIESNTVATILTIRVRRINATTAPSGGTAVGVLATNTSDAAINAANVVQTYPTTKGSVDANAAGVRSYSLAISAAQAAMPQLGQITIYDWKDSPDIKPLTIRASTGEGIAVELNSSAASTIVASIDAEFTRG